MSHCLAFLEVPVTSVAMPLAELGGAAVDQPMNLLTRRSVARRGRRATGRSRRSGRCG